MAKKKTGETHGPFDAYTEVHTGRGVFGLQPGKVLTISEDGTVEVKDAPKKGRPSSSEED